jgi:uncharacterized C2H2 Zn-finger protein
MKCPHCEYINGWDNETLSSIEGKHGNFYKLPITMKRESYDNDEENVFGCPKCKKIFMDSGD